MLHYLSLGMGKDLRLHHDVLHNLKGIFSNVHFCQVTTDLSKLMGLQSEVNGSQLPLGAFQHIGSVMLQS